MDYDLELGKRVAAIVSYAFIIFLFLRALAFPAQNLNFIYHVGIFIFITEFLSIHSSGMLVGSWRLRDKLFLLAFYLVFVAVFSFSTGSYYPALIFAVSLVAKAFRPPKTTLEQIGIPVMIFMASVFLVLMLAPIISRLFVFSPAVLAAKDANSSGTFVDTPQTLLVWGVVYYAGLIAAGEWMARKDARTATAVSKAV